MADSVKIKSIFQKANRAAAEQDPDVRARILGSLAIKAADDPAFREALRKNPTQVAEKEAAISNLQVSPEDLKEVGQKAKELTSRAVPDAGGVEVKDMVFRTIRDIETSFRLTLTLSKFLFHTGLAMVVASFIIVSVFKDKQTAAIFFGVGGLLNLIVGTVMNALDRVRNAAVNLIQIQMAYLAYYKILHLLGPVEGVTSKDDAIAYAEELTANVDKIMASLQGVIRAAKETSDSKKTDRNKGQEEDKNKSKANKTSAPRKKMPAATP
jgi:hypothetical protein